MAFIAGYTAHGEGCGRKRILAIKSRIFARFAMIGIELTKTDKK